MRYLCARRKMVLAAAASTAALLGVQWALGITGASADGGPMPRQRAPRYHPAPRPKPKPAPRPVCYGASKWGLQPKTHKARSAGRYYPTMRLDAQKYPGCDRVVFEVPGTDPVHYRVKYLNDRQRGSKIRLLEVVIGASSKSKLKLPKPPGLTTKGKGWVVRKVTWAGERARQSQTRYIVCVDGKKPFRVWTWETKIMKKLHTAYVIVDVSH